MVPRYVSMMTTPLPGSGLTNHAGQTACAACAAGVSAGRAVGICLGTLIAVGSGVAVSIGGIGVRLGVELAVASGVLVGGNGVADGVDVDGKVAVGSRVIVGSAVEVGANAAGDETALPPFSQPASAKSASSNNIKPLDPNLIFRPPVCLPIRLRIS